LTSIKNGAREDPRKRHSIERRSRRAARTRAERRPAPTSFAQKINIKPMPRIMFEIDHGAMNAATVEKVFLEHDGKIGGEEEKE